MMELNGALSNPFQRDKVLQTARSVVTILTRKPRRRKKKEIPQRAGDIKAAIIRALELSTDPMRLPQIHSACEEYLGRSVKYDTIKDCVHKHSRGQQPAFSRVSHGKYLSVKRQDD
jgi:hypothetical protein